MNKELKDTMVILGSFIGGTAGAPLAASGTFLVCALPYWLLCQIFGDDTIDNDWGWIRSISIFLALLLTPFVFFTVTVAICGMGREMFNNYMRAAGSALCIGAAIPFAILMFSLLAG